MENLGWVEIIVIVNAVLHLAQAIVDVTPSEKDNAIVKRIKGFVALFSQSGRKARKEG